MLGPFSETWRDLQLELLTDHEPGVTREEVEAEAQRERIPKRERQRHPGRQRLPEHLPRVEQLIRCEETGSFLLGSCECPNHRAIPWLQAGAPECG